MRREVSKEMQGVSPSSSPFAGLATRKVLTTTSTASYHFLSLPTSSYHFLPLPIYRFLPLPTVLLPPLTTPDYP